MSSNDARGESFPASELVEMIKSCNNARKYSIFIVAVREENYEVKLLFVGRNAAAGEGECSFG